MLIEKAEQIIELSLEKSKIESYARNLAGFQSRQEQISQAVAEILPIVTALLTFRQRSLITSDLAQKAEPILAFITIVEEKFKEDPEWILDNKNFKGNIFKSSVDGLTKILKEQLLQAWIKYLNRHMPSTNQEMLNLLDRIDAFKPTVQKIKNLDKLISRSTFPQNNEEFEHTERLINQLRESWDSLSSDEVPDEVLPFLKAAADQGAPYKLLTSDVKKWIERYEIADSIQIRLTS